MQGRHLTDGVAVGLFSLQWRDLGDDVRAIAQCSFLLLAPVKSFNETVAKNTLGLAMS
jgi:hypothetical protein